MLALTKFPLAYPFAAAKDVSRYACVATAALLIVIVVKLAVDGRAPTTVSQRG